MKKNTLVLLGVLLFCARAVPAFAADAAALFKSKCVMCHGKDMKGNPSMAKMFKLEPAALDLTGKAVLSKSDAALVKIITDGKNKMPAQKANLTAAEIGALVAYLKGAQPGAAAAPAAPAKTGRESGGAAAAKEDAPAGNTVYTAKCASCHGKDKKGNAGMAKAFKVEPAALDLTSKETQAKSDEELLKIILDGKDKMPAFKDKLDEGQIKELVGFIKPAAAKSEPEAAEAAGGGPAEVRESGLPEQAPVTK
ncbi:MAG: cytochrome c [Elusimicrobia bacterium]|nr:cytochrome c [Elusimicrobiota bacterium]